jgi:hypothetical protein
VFPGFDELLNLASPEKEAPYIKQSSPPAHIENHLLAK